MQTFTNAVDALHTSCPISATHALRILCLGVRMMDLERYADDPQGATPPWNTLFQAMARLLQTALIASPYSVSSLGPTAPTSYSSIALPCEDVQLAEVCLEHIQKSDMKILATSESEGECTYDRSLGLSERQTTVFGDDLVALLGTIAGPHIPPDKLRNFFRLRKLGVAQDLWLSSESESSRTSNESNEWRQKGSVEWSPSHQTAVPEVSHVDTDLDSPCSLTATKTPMSDERISGTVTDNRVVGEETSDTSELGSGLAIPLHLTVEAL